jgi:hypothetical protein
MNVQKRKRGKQMKVSLLPLTRLFMFQTVLTMVLAIPFSNAHAQRHRPSPGPQPAPMPAPGYGTQEVKKQLNQYLYQGERINLIQSLGLHHELNSGKKLISVSVKAQSTQYNSSLKLIMDGQTIGHAQLTQQMGLKVFNIPAHTAPQKLKLAVVGGAYVKMAKASLSSYGPGPGPGPQPGNGRLRAVLNQHISAQTILPVRRLIKEQNPGVQLRGKKLQKVILKASSRRGRAQAQLLINGMPVGYSQTIPVQESRLVFQLDNYGPNIMGQDVKKSRTSNQW